MYDYDIALSFSMEEKDLVEQVYHYLRTEGISVFFAPAPECQEVLSGRNQREVFYEIFGLKTEKKIELNQQQRSTKCLQSNPQH